MKFLFAYLLSLLTMAVHAKSNLCDVLQLPNCHGVTKQLRRNAFQSAPTSSTASNLNPANTSFDKGLGVEALGQANNPILYGLISGTGKMGGALISGSPDNGFFGNRVPELPEEITKRTEEKHQFKNQKLTLALAGKLVSQKNLGLDAGLILKRHSELKKVNYGLGISGRIWLLHFGASAYQDDFFIDYTRTIRDGTGSTYAQLYEEDSASERFVVTTYTVGTRFSNFAVDYGLIKSKLDFYGTPTDIALLSASVYYKDLLLSFASRKETSAQTIFVEGELDRAKEKSATYLGLQYSLNQHMIMGANYNYFLLKELSLTLTLFI